MHVHIIHAHPEPTSYNGALTKAAQQALQQRGDTVTISDLYQSGFDPVEKPANYPDRADMAHFAALNEQRHAWQNGTLPGVIETEIANLEQADLVVLQFPLWWHGPPAILKGWFDRVFVSGGLYSSSKRYDSGHFRGKRAVLSVTTGAPRQAFAPGSRGGDFDTMLWPLQYSLHYMGFSVLPPFISFGVQGHGYCYEGADSLKKRLAQNLDEWRCHLGDIGRAEPLVFPGWSDWDEDGCALDLKG